MAPEAASTATEAAQRASAARTIVASTALVALAAVCWGLAGGVGGILVDRGWDPFVVAFCRGAVGLGCALMWLVLRPGGSGFANGRLWFWSLLAGLGVSGNFAFYFVSIDEGSVAVAATLMYCAPVFVYLVSFALGLEPATAPKWIAIAGVLVGIALLTRIHDLSAGELTAWGVGAGLLAGLAYAVFIFGFRYAAAHGSPAAILTIAFAVLLAILAWPADSRQILAVPHASSWPLFAGLGVLGAGLSFGLYVVGLKHTPPAVASIVAMVEPVTAALFGVLLLDERLAGMQVIGMALILATVTGMGAIGGRR